MDRFGKIYELYRTTGALFVVLLVLTGSIFYVLYANSGISNTTPVSKPDVTLDTIQKQQNKNLTARIQSGSNCQADGSIDPEEMNFFNLLNQYRQSQGLQPVTLSTNLSEMAQWFANDMATKNYFNMNHMDSLGRFPEGTRSVDCGITAFEGEITNGGFQTGQQNFDAWKNSPEHNTIMLSPKNVQLGIGRANNPNSTYKWYWAADFNYTDDGSGPPPPGGGEQTPTPIQPPAQNTCPANTICDNVNLPGQDIFHYPSELSTDKSPNPADCQYACNQDPNCKAWTWVKPGIQQADAVCWEKGSVPAAVSNNDTSSGAKSSFNLPGSGGITPPPPPGVTNPPPHITNPPPNTQYSLSVTLDKQTYHPGDSIKLCYTLTPQGTAFHVRLLEGINDATPILVDEWDDDGSGGGDCNTLSLASSAAAGPRKFIVEALINGQKKAEGTATMTVVVSGTTPGQIPSPTGAAAPGQPTATPTTDQTQPTATPPVPPGSGNISLSAILPGIGSNVKSGQNSNPLNTSKNGYIRLIDTQTGQALPDDITAVLNFDSSTGKFSGPAGAKAGIYDVKIKTDNSLWKNVGIVSLVSGQTATPTTVNVITGDLNGDNILDLADYNIFLSCYGAKQCDPAGPEALQGRRQKQQADLNLDGKVDEKDLNIFYSGLASREGD